MPIHNSEIDPYDADESTYECRSCGNRERTTSTVTVCPACGGTVQNIAVSRE